MTGTVLRYRPYLALAVAAVAAAVLAILPPPGDGPGGAATIRAGPTQEQAIGEPLGVAPEPGGGLPEPQGSDGDQGSIAVAAPGRAVEPRAAGAGTTIPRATAGGTPAATGGVRYPGTGTPQALANPRCDRALQRVRYPSSYAPSCVAPWPEGADNGGSTSRGVTADSIRIVVYEDPNGMRSTSRSDVERVTRETLLMRMGIYETWGRKLDIRFFQWSGTDEVAQRADAVEIATNLKPFIATSMLAYGSAPRRVWAQELAARGVITWDPVVTAKEANATPGYRYGFTVDDRINALAVGEYVAKRLWGRPTRWAGDPAMRASTRTFGLLYDEAWDRATFEATLQKFRPGAKVAEAIGYDPQEDLNRLQEQANVQIARLKAAKVTNVVNVGGLFYTVILTRAATAQAFYPEWTITGWDVSDTIVGGRLADPAQWRNAFGIGSLPPFIKPNHLREDQYQYEWKYGKRLNGAGEETVLGEINTFARDFLAGVHLAGPVLTPETLRAALFAMEPRGGRWCGCVTNMGVSFGHHLTLYGGDKYFSNEDFTEKWWDPATTGTDEIGLSAAGVYRYVAGGKRYLPGDIPASEPPMFDPAGTVTGYEGTAPPRDRYPTYPKE